jgi:hypothetical protein
MSNKRFAPPPTKYGPGTAGSGGPGAVQRAPAPGTPVAAVAPPTRFGPVAAQAKPVVRALPPGPPPPSRPGPPGRGTVVQKMEMEVSGSDADDEGDDDSAVLIVSPTLARVKLGANQSETHHIVPTSKLPLPKTKKFAHLYTGTEGLRGMRSFGGERPRQILRWIATALFARFPDAVEIQCYWHAGSATLWISSNKLSVNKKLVEGFKGGVCQAVASSYTAGRQFRHAKKLFVRDKHEGQQDIFTAFSAGTVHIPLTDHTDGEKKSVDVHAERRIQAAIGEDLDPAFLAGVKRPCLVCATALKILGSSRPGPSWNSRPALYGYSLEEVLAHAEANNIMTHVTLDRFTNKLDTGHDTDSDSGDDK